ncbi:MAG: hypothetical protein A2V69_02370 [Candidatus Portnoybacteria bacterium RBG_13_40_8]|uniref:Radical SAM core domain-containing protein n=1 Tax=Candidatus Portnoybacteria bacterium RBG_13_40_8 TaxID=1801990 RepID=A0A1G2F495_9BACT|nr:MAG: hypothetical protein A2V69_02370 [Candidatus Portnoybacteria bacterium RBG_13_40_8]OGZ35803.1 MAG: hypothetical protein A2V60_02975 [Candidatus Portnoybacteria bacterium RIFCSPHIGHO2_01_FULL_39_19]
MKKNISKIKKIGWGFGRCNMNCQHCYNASRKTLIKYKFSDLKRIADKICQQDITDINFGTGEFLMNSNALRTAQYINKKYPYIKLGLTTNGFSVVYMNEKILKKLFHDIDVSIDFPEKEKHNSFRRHPQAWEWANKALSICQESDIERSIVACVTSKTRDQDIINLLKLAKKYSASLRINWFRPTGRGKKELCINALRFWKIIYLFSKYAVFEGLSDPILQAFLSNKKKFNHCSCGWTSARIQQDLTVTPCVFLKGKRWDSGHILKDHLKEIYKHKNFQDVRKRKPKVCLGCNYYQFCQGGCASRAFLQTGGLDKPDAYCPFRDKRIKELIEKIKRIITIKDSNKVHNGYLCTLITRPK